MFKLILIDSFMMIFGMMNEIFSIIWLYRIVYMNPFQLSICKSIFPENLNVISYCYINYYTGKCSKVSLKAFTLNNQWSFGVDPKYPLVDLTNIYTHTISKIFLFHLLSFTSNIIALVRNIFWWTQIEIFKFAKTRLFWHLDAEIM